MKQKKPEKPKIQPRERTPGRWLRLLVLVVACMLLVVAMGLTTSPEQYNLSVGDIAPKTITATKDVIDEAQTEENRERAADAVQPVYQEDEAALDLVMDNLEKVFSEFESIRAFGEGLRSGKTASAAGEDYVYTGTFAREDLDLARDMCETMNLSDWQLTILMKLSESDFSTAYVNTVNAVRKTMEATIREGGVEVAIASIQRQLLQYISSDLCLNIIVPAVRACIMPNMVINQEETELKREEARQAVEPVYYKSGQNIVVAGESVTEAQLRVLDSLGLLEGNQFDVMLLTGVTVLGILSAVALALPLLMFDWMRMTRLRNALILAVLFVLTMGLCVLAAQVNPYLAPTAMVALLGDRAAFSQHGVHCQHNRRPFGGRVDQYGQHHLCAANAQHDDGGPSQRAGRHFRAVPPPSAARRRIAGGGRHGCDGFAGHAGHRLPDQQRNQFHSDQRPLVRGRHGAGRAALHGRTARAGMVL